MMDAILKLVTEIHKDVREVDRKLTAHIADETASATTLIKEFREHAFVNGDMDQHRQMQQIALARAEENNRLRHELGNAVVKWGVAGALGFVVYAIWRAILEGPK